MNNKKNILEICDLFWKMQKTCEDNIVAELKHIIHMLKFCILYDWVLLYVRSDEHLYCISF